MSKSMNRRTFLHTAALGGASLALAPWLSRCGLPAKKPNIVVILADDLGYGDVACLNADSRIPTPNIDRIAGEGIRMTDAHSPSAVCTPTRYGLLTGRYCWRTRLKSGVLWGYSPNLIAPQRLTIASMLKQHGYHTACVGKWHLGLGDREKTDYTQPFRPGPNDLGFDYFFGIPASLDMEPYCYVENDRPTMALTEKVAASKRWEGGFWRAGPVAPDFKHGEVLSTITEKAVGFIDGHVSADTGQPLFLYFALTAPHTPIMPEERFKGQSGAGDYGDFVVQVDWSVGEILKALDRHGLSDDTLLIVTSDNGSDLRHESRERYDHRSSYHFRGQKADAWDGGHRIPFIARWPGHIQAGNASDETVCLTDIMATCAAVVDEPLPDNAAEDSYDILPALTGLSLAGPIREATIHHSVDGMFAIRHGRWKLILGRGSGGFTKPQRITPGPGEPVGQLYDLETDIGEQNNLYPERPEVVARLTALLDKYRAQGHSHPAS